MNRFVVALAATTALVIGLSEMAVADPTFGPAAATTEECGQLWGWAEDACLYRQEANR